LASRTRTSAHQRFSGSIPRCLWFDRRSRARRKRIEYEGSPAKVFRPEYIIAIAASVGRHKDFARIEQMLDQVKIDKTLLDEILQRYNLKLPNK
jgi:hypothetical protein